jgi:hypothetical protein
MKGGGQYVRATVAIFKPTAPISDAKHGDADYASRRPSSAQWKEETFTC